MKKVLSIILVLSVLLSTFAGLGFQANAATLPSSGQCGENVTYTFDSSTGKLVISGSGAMSSYIGSSSSPFYKQSAIKSIEIQSGVTSIGSDAFYSCQGLTSVVISNSVTEIGSSAFCYCHALAVIEIPNGVKRIGAYAFRDCTAITSLSIPRSVTYIESYAFASCGNLTQISVDPDNLKYDSRDDCNALIETATNKLLLGCQNTVIPNDVWTIGENAFIYCRELTGITIPNSVTKIGNEAFYGCSALNDITIPDSVTDIGDNAFSGCYSLTSISIPDSVETIGNWAFFECRGLTSVTIPSSVTSVGKCAFKYCSCLTEVFYFGTQEQWNSISIKEENEPLINATLHLVKIEDKCGDNIQYTFDSNTGVLTISGNGAMFDYYQYSSNTSPFNNSKDIQKVVIEDGVTSIGDYAFYGCSRLTSIKIPNSVTKIGFSAFYGCIGLTSITIPSSVTSIKEGAFYRCGGLMELKVNPNNKFFDSRDNCNAIIEKSTNTLITGCKNTVIPNSVTNIGEGAFFECSNLISITIPDSVTSIGRKSFYECGELIEITIPNSVTSIGSSAFESCSSLSSVIIPDSITSIELCVFRGCSELTSIAIPNSVKSIGNASFYECEGLASIVIPNSVRNIDDFAFCKCKGLKSVIISNSAISIGNSAFSGCSGLTCITIPDSVKSIDNFAFSGCSGMTDITIGNSLTSIGEYAFFNCSGLTSVTIPDSVTIIGNSAFSSCISLQNVYYAGSAQQWENIQIGIDNSLLTAAHMICNCGDLWMPSASISSTNLVSAVQIVTLSFNDNAGVAGYYWGKSSDYLKNKYYALSDMPTKKEVEKTITESGTYYLVAIDTSNNLSPEISVRYFKAILNANGGSADLDYIIAASGKGIKLPVASRQNNTFKGWGESEDDTNPILIWYPASNLQLYAVWEHTHSYDCKVTAATCTESGKKVYTCTICGDSYSETIPALGHNYTAVVTAPTCKAQGYTTHTCTNCGDSYQDSYTAVTSHSFGSGKVTKNASCTEEGTRLFTCSVCGENKTETIPALGHNYTAVVTAPTCTAQGYTTHTCTGCGDSYQDNYTAVTSHSFGSGKVTKNASCTEEGTRLFTCSVCGENKTEIIPALGHNYTAVVTAPTCTAQGYTTHTCTNCGDQYRAQYTNKTAHSFNSGVVTKAATCSKAGEKTFTCTVCGTVQTQAIPATGSHTWNSGVVTKAATCSKAGEKTFTCTVCGIVQTQAIPATGSHTWNSGKVTKAATCSKAGEKTFTCTVCGTVQTQAIPATGAHAWNSGKVTKAATCTAYGVKTYTCSLCNTTKTESIAKAAHTYTNVITKATTAKNGLVVKQCSVCGEINSKASVYYPKTITLSGTRYTYIAGIITPKVTVKDAAGKVIAAKYYTLTYAAGRMQVGRYAVKITFKGLYSGSVMRYFDIVPRPSAIKKASKPAKAQFAIKWSKVSGISGYQIQTANTKDFKKGLKTVNAKASSTNARFKTGIKSNTPYYIRIRTYKVVKFGGKNLVLYSNWSKAAGVKTK